MSKGYKKRVETIEALIHSSVVQGYPVEYVAIIDEYENILEARYQKKETRKYILMALHAFRGADTFLNRFVDYYGIMPNIPTIGNYLRVLAQHHLNNLRQLTRLDWIRFRINIKEPRNEYLHKAGSYPQNRQEIYTLLSELDYLITTVINL